VKGIHYLHSKRIIHMDLKASNILLTGDGTAKVADVGLAAMLNKTYATDVNGMGTFSWAAPELLLGTRVSEMADMYRCAPCAAD
jgi:serine/threonine protein kinase